MSARDRAENTDDVDPVEVQEVLDAPDEKAEPATKPSEQPPLPDFNP